MSPHTPPLTHASATTQAAPFSQPPLTPIALPAFADNYLWAVVRGHHALVIDPGDAAVIEQWLARNQLTLTTILLTHHHADHVGGVPALAAKYTPAVYGPAEDIHGITQLVHGGEVLDLGRFGTATVMAVPGHTRAHMAYHFVNDALLFCGDTLFSAGCGRLFEGTAAQLYQSLQQIAALPDTTQICCAHEYTAANLRFAAVADPGNPAVIARQSEVQTLRANHQPSLPVLLSAERHYNPFLRCAEPAVIAAASAAAGHALDAGLPTFTALRAWKDRF